jgi:hypothetical protein
LRTPAALMMPPAATSTADTVMPARNASTPASVSSTRAWAR